jgi:hypothetical protein
MLSVWYRTKVITLSGFYCISIFFYIFLRINSDEGQMGFKAKQEFREVDKLIKDLSKQSLSTSTLTSSTSKHSSSPPLSTKSFQPSVVSNHRFTSTMSSTTRTSLSEERHSASKATTTTTTTNRNSIFAWRRLPILKNTSLFLLLSILRHQLLFEINEWPYLTFVSKLFKIFLDNSKVLSIIWKLFLYQSCRKKPEGKFESNKKFRIGEFWDVRQFFVRQFKWI